MKCFYYHKYLKWYDGGHVVIFVPLCHHNFCWQLSIELIFMGFYLIDSYPPPKNVNKLKEIKIMFNTKGRLVSSIKCLKRGL